MEEDDFLAPETVQTKIKLILMSEAGDREKNGVKVVFKGYFCIKKAPATIKDLHKEITKGL